VLEDNILKDKNISGFKTLVYPEWGSISPELKSLLLEYVENGGNLVLIGPHNASLFREVLDVQFLNEPQVRTNGLMYEGMLANIQSTSVSVSPGAKAMAFGVYYDGWDTRTKPKHAATITPYGNGKIACVYFDCGDSYMKRTTTVQRDFMKALIERLMPEPSIKVNGSHYLDVVNSFTSEGKQAIHLVNTAGPHANENSYLTFDDFPAVGPISIAVQALQKPKKVILQPENKTLPFEYNNNTITCTVPSIEIYDILVIEF
jgi:hypothetical protein